MTSMQFVIQPLPGTDDQFIERLREVTDKVNKFGFGTHRIFEQLKIPVKEVVIGPYHIGVLLEDGKAFRVAFSIHSDRLDLSKSDGSKNVGGNAAAPSNTPKSSAPSSSRQLARSRARLMRTTSRATGQSSGSRSTGVIIGGTSSSRPLVTVPATYVPEELISQAEVVLQGKSRNLIIRELQRTNLDVNLAVNNLLSRDDEEAEDTEEGGDNYVPEDLISLLDNGFHGDNNSVIIDPSDGLFSEEIFSNYSNIRNERNQTSSGSADNSSSRASTSTGNVLVTSASLSAQISSVSGDREAFSRWRDRQYYGPRRWLNKDDYVWEKDADSKKKESSASTSPIWISEELQAWPDKSNQIRFKKIAALYSEFIGLSETGELHQWKWSEPDAYKSEVENVFHPKTLILNLTENVEQISANFIRCSVVTESNRVATWMDEHLGYLGAKLEHQAIAFNEFLMDPIASINVCSLYTAVRTESNNVYWWGVLPYEQRRNFCDKYRAKTKKPAKVAGSDITVGSQVTMKKSPLYQPGSIGFTCVNGVPKVGQLLGAVWDFNDVVNFKILNVAASSGSEKSQPGGAAASAGTDKDAGGAKGLSMGSLAASQAAGSGKTSSGGSNKESADRIDMPPPPSPASSTCSDTGSVSSKRAKRMAPEKEGGDTKKDDEHKKDEEYWQLKDVVFVEDKIGPVGKVLKVDGDFLAVRFPAPTVCGTAAACPGAEGGKDDDWQLCRLVRREDVQVYKSAMTTRGPDWLQKVPKKINITHGVDPANFQLLALAVDTKGIHVIKKVASKLHYSLYNLYNSKQEQNCQFPTDSNSFLGASVHNIMMACSNDCGGGSSTIVVRDGNRALYPLAKDCIGSIKDPQWFDLPPVKAISMTTLSLSSIGSNLKSKVCMTALLFESQKIMPHILRCDVKNAAATLGRLEKEDKCDVAAVIEERCDGGRNIFHACTVMCAPTSNKDIDEKKAPINAATTAKATTAAQTQAPSSSASSSAASSAAASSAAGTNVIVPGGGGSNASTASSGPGGPVFPNISLEAGATGGGGGANSLNSTSFSVAVAALTSAPSSSGGQRDSRTLSLREIMNRLISNEHGDQQPPQQQPTPAQQAAGSNSVASMNLAEDYYISPTWSADASAGSNTGNSNDVVMGHAADEDIAMLLANPAGGGGASAKLSSPNYTFDSAQRREQAIVILQQMCCSPALRPHLPQLLSAKDAQGQTPFMLAVASRAYEAGLILLNTIMQLADKEPALKDSMIFPAGSPPDQSPLHVICYNDTCSFTWTGADHINQNIYECKTCGLTGSLCCCTECARVCHKGHDCKLKRTSPTAYCDCWEKCKCKALIAGNQTKRFELLCKLALSTDLVTKFNSKGESILLFLIQTVGRQTVEQRQYRANSRVRNVGSGPPPNGGAAAAARKAAGGADADPDMPEHDLEPPKFARKALEHLLVDWHALRSMIMSGAERHEQTPQQAPNSLDGASAESYNIYLQSQNGSTLLDKFTHSLFVKCTGEHLDLMVMALVREMQNEAVKGRPAEAEKVARRFVRSVARVFVIFNLEKLPNPERRKPTMTPNKHIQSCIKVFQTLHRLSIQELCEISEALIAPVRLGVVRPTAPFAMSASNMDNSDDLFSVEPLAPSSAAEVIIEPVAPHEASQSGAFNMPQNYGMDNIDTLRDASENEDGPGRENNAHAQDDDILEGGARNDEGIQDDESDNDFNFNDAETESDSDDNQSNQDAQRSVQTGATAGSETDESGDSSVQEEEASEDGETDDQSDEFNFADHQLERRNTNSNVRNDLAPQSMQWAIRNRDTARTSMRMPTGSNLVFIDPMALRRSAVQSSSAVSAAPQEHHTMATTAANLSRAFGIIIRQISDLLHHVSYAAAAAGTSSTSSTASSTTQPKMPLRIDNDEILKLQEHVEQRLRPTWNWMFSVMDGTEAQLKFGAYLTNYTDPTHPLHPLNLSAQSSSSPPASTTPSSTVGINLLGSSSRREFFTYCLSLMRAHTSEHRDALPVLDITALRHIAYVLDGFIYYMRNEFYDKVDQPLQPNPNNSTTSTINTAAAADMADDSDDELSSIANEEQFADASGSMATGALPQGSASARRHSFFVRSDSTLSLGCLAPDGFDLPLDVAMPLADKPHLLQPNSKREDLFSNLPLTITQSPSAGGEKAAPNLFNLPPTRLGFSNYVRDAPMYGEQRHDDEEQSDSDDEDGDDDQVAAVPPENPQPSTSAAAGRVSNAKVRLRDPTESNVFVKLKKKKLSSDEPNAFTESPSKVAKADAMDVDDAPGDTQPSPSRPEIIISPGNNKQRHFDSLESGGGGGGSGGSGVRSVIVRVGGAGVSGAAGTIILMDGAGNGRKDDPICLEAKANAAKTNETEEPSKASAKSTFVFPSRGVHFCKDLALEVPSWNFLLGRWKLTLDLFGRVFMDDVGMEHGSVLPELRGFPVKEMRFRRLMEKLRNGQQRDLILCKLERNRDSLIIQTFKELNTQFGSQNRRLNPPLNFNRVKVTFKDEPGEGSGVARSFYTSISEALLASAKMPNLESVQVGSNSKYSIPFSSMLRNRSGSARDTPTLARRGTGSKILWRTNRSDRKTLNYDARPYVPSSSSGNSDNPTENPNEHLSYQMQQLGDRLYPKIYSINPPHASKITGMLMEIPPQQLLSIVSSEEILRQKVAEALEIINMKLKTDPQSKKAVPVVLLEQCQLEDNEPLFYSPGKRGFYTPRQGYGSFERINAFRNIGRLIGLCLLQNELLPLFLQRHVLKYILGRKIKFHDLAFFDPVIYESFRQLLLNSQTEEGEANLSRMELYFVIDLMKEEGGGSVELIPGGREILVTSSNVYEYIRRYTEYRLIKSQEKALEALKDGVFDVLPDSCMNNLTSEDLRLLLNGVGDINVTTLISYTNFNDESSEGSDKLLKFKRWFWSIVEKMNTLERQDLVYFWTGSPALPASEEGFQPLPSVTIRPADDSHLPTANTCISRLYIPLYSSKSILRSKLLLAIKSKNFGFV